MSLKEVFKAKMVIILKKTRDRTEPSHTRETKIIILLLQILKKNVFIFARFFLSFKNVNKYGTNKH
jgi:hypothetical protein